MDEPCMEDLRAAPSQQSVAQLPVFHRMVPSGTSPATQSRVMRGQGDQRALGYAQLPSASQSIATPGGSADRRIGGKSARHDICFVGIFGGLGCTRSGLAPRGYSRGSVGFLEDQRWTESPAGRYLCTRRFIALQGESRARTAWAVHVTGLGRKGPSLHLGG